MANSNNEYVSLVMIPRKWFNTFTYIFSCIIVLNTIIEFNTNWYWRSLGDTLLTRTSVLMSLIVGWFFILSNIWSLFMFGYARIFKEKVFAEGKAEGKAERDREWIEWVENGKDPDKMPYKIKPVNSLSNQERDRKKS